MKAIPRGMAVQASPRLWIVSACTAFGAAFYPLVYHWQHNDLDRARHQSPDHHDRQRLLDFGAGSGRDDKRYQAYAAYQRAQQLGSQANAGAGDHGVVQLHAPVAKLVDVRHHHHPVLYRNPKDRNESNQRRNAQRKTRDQQERCAADKRNRNIEDDRQRVAQRTEAGIDQDEHQQQRNRYGNQQPSRSLLRVFELPAPGDEISGRSLDSGGNRRLRVMNEAADVSPGDIALHHDAAQSVLAAYDRIATRKAKRCQLSERHPSANRRGDQNVAELFNLVAVVFLQAYEYRKVALAFEHVRRLVSADGNLGDFEHVGDVESVTSQLIAIQRDLHVLLTRDLLDRQVFRSANTRHGVANPFGYLRQVVLVFTKNLDGNLRIDAR